jgi:hypothetical protein
VEALSGVPVAVSCGNRARAGLWPDEWAARDGYDVLAGGGAVTDEALRHQDALIVPHTEDALVEEHVVQRAQAQPVLDLVGASERPPAQWAASSPTGTAPILPSYPQKAHRYS